MLGVAIEWATVESCAGRPSQLRSTLQPAGQKTGGAGSWLFTHDGMVPIHGYGFGQCSHHPFLVPVFGLIDKEGRFAADRLLSDSEIEVNNTFSKLKDHSLSPGTVLLC